MGCIMNLVAAIVVTYNRQKFLVKCIHALLEQSIKCDILIIDNASTDKTFEYIKQAKKEYQNIFYFNTGENLGGAGGFNYGIKKALFMKYKYIWLMDDDCFPTKTALEILLKYDKILNGKYGWLASEVLWTDFSLCKMNYPKLKRRIKNNFDMYHLIEAIQASFVSLFLTVDTVKCVGLPVKEFFIWGDDVEFTRRIAVRKKLKSFYVPESKVIHAMRDNNGSNIATDTVSRLDRYIYAFRNEYFLFHKEGIKGILFYHMKCCFNILKIICIAKSERIKRMKIIIDGYMKGKNFHPCIEYFQTRNEESQCLKK